jgi:lipopolysaccharide/colanic/teichoic acid biosynthesis glycosyltransferase
MVKVDCSKKVATMNLYTSFCKRVLDIVFSLLVIIILSPLIIAVFLVLLISYKANPFFVQPRPGKDEKEIKIIKFKSMNDNKDASGHLLPDNQRLTTAGKFCRKYSLDELPQLFNVLKGDMSLVGPRPLLSRYLPLYNTEQKRRHEVRPGITGWAQVNGRNSIGWTEKFKYDVYYVDNLSFSLDMKILWKTALKVIKKEGLNQSDERPMQPFEGNN